MSTTKDASHHDLFEIEKVFKEMGDQLKSADIDIRGFFLNADAGFDSYELRTICSQNGSKPTSKLIQETLSKTARRPTSLMKNYTKTNRY